MNLFKKTEESYYNQLRKLGPLWLAEFKEMDANYQFAAWTLELMEHFMNSLVNNQFPRLCDEDTLILYESLLKIKYPSEVSIEERRRTVEAFWPGNSKLSRSEIKLAVSRYTGFDSNVYWDDGTLIVEFVSDNPSDESIALLRGLLKRLMPAHIEYDIIVIADNSEAEMKAGVSAPGKCIIMSSTGD